MVYTLRALGESTYGILTYTIGIGTLLSSFTTIIHRDVIILNLAQKRNLGTFLCTSIVVNIMTSLVTLSLIILIDKATRFFIILSMYIFISLLYFKNILTYRILFKSQNLSKYVAIATIVSTYLAAMVKIMIIYYDLGLKFLVMSYVFEWCVYFLSLYILFVLKIEFIEQLTYDVRTSKHLIKNSFPLIISGLFIAIFLHSDIVILEKLTTFTDVGLYSAAVRLSSIWYVIPSVITVAFMPAMATTSDVKVLKKNFNTTLWILICLSVIATLFMFIFSSTLVVSLFGNSFSLSSNILKIHILSLSAIFLSMHYDQLFVIKNYNKYIMISYALATSLNVTLNLVFIPIFNGIGAAIATVLAYNTKLLYSIYMTKKLRILDHTNA